MTTTANPSIFSIALRQGGMLAIILIAYNMLVITLGQSGNWTLGLLSLVLVGGAVYLAMREFKSKNSGMMRYGQGVGLGTLTALIGGLILAAYMFAYASFLDPEYLPEVIRLAQEQVAGFEDSLPESQYEDMLTRIETNTTAMSISINSLIGTGVVGVIFSLVIAAIMRTKPTQQTVL